MPVTCSGAACGKAARYLNPKNSQSIFIAMVKKLLAFVFVFIAMLELASYFYIKYVNTNIQMPSYSFVNVNSKFWTFSNEHFGVWHQPSSSYLHKKACFTQTYASNAYGMRDKERTKGSDQQRVVILGDSFIEGWGNKAEDRLSNLLEASTGKEVLNFGTSGGFGTIQEWLQYKYMVKQFRHDVVMLGILPRNDFEDNSLEFYHTQDTDDYRPFLVGEYPDYKLFYPVSKLPQPTRMQAFGKSLQLTLLEWSCLYRVAIYLHDFKIENMKLVPRWSPENASAQAGGSMYYSVPESEWSIMRYSLEQLVAEAGSRKVILFTIPAYQDFEHYDGKEPPLARKLRELANRTGATYVDLMPAMVARGIKYPDLYFSCDKHWNAFGNAVAADILEPYVRAALQSTPVKGN